MVKQITTRQAAQMIPEGASILFGGFSGCGSAHEIIHELARLGTGNLTMICNDGGMLDGPDGDAYYGVAKLIRNRQVRRLIASHVGLNPEVSIQMNAGSLDVTLIPQGSLVEMIRAGGAGLGGVLTPAGLGTLVQDAWHVHSVVEIDDRRYLLERPLRADFALLQGYRVDTEGNVWYRGTSRNFNPAMATAADVVIVEAVYIVEAGAILPEDIVTPGALVDYVAAQSGRGV